MLEGVRNIVKQHYALKIRLRKLIFATSCR